MATITFVEARQIFDSRGNVTVEVDVHTSTGVKATAAAPTGASTGIYEALELGGGGSNYLGKGVLEAVGNVNSIIGPALIGKDPTQQTSIDNFMVHRLDRTQKLEANAILAVSLAVCKAGSVVSGIPLYKHIADLAGIDKSLVLPIPAFNVINADNKVGFMILPVAASSFKEALDMGVNVFTELKPKIAEINASYNGDEEPPNIQNPELCLKLLKAAIDKLEYTGNVGIGMDVAASSCYSSDTTYDGLNFNKRTKSLEMNSWTGTSRSSRNTRLSPLKTLFTKRIRSIML